MLWVAINKWLNISQRGGGAPVTNTNNQAQPFHSIFSSLTTPLTKEEMDVRSSPTVHDPLIFIIHFELFFLLGLNATHYLLFWMINETLVRVSMFSLVVQKGIPTVELSNLKSIISSWPLEKEIFKSS